MIFAGIHTFICTGPTITNYQACQWSRCQSSTEQLTWVAELLQGSTWFALVSNFSSLHQELQLVNQKHLYILNQRHITFEASGLTRSLSCLLNGLCLHSCQWSVREKICLIFEKFPFLEKPDSWDTLGQPPLSSGWTVGIHYTVYAVFSAIFQRSLHCWYQNINLEVIK